MNKHKEDKQTKNKHGLGRSLINTSHASKHNMKNKGSLAHVSEKLDQKSEKSLRSQLLSSVLMQNSLQQFISLAKMANKSFEVERVSHSARLIPLNNKNLTDASSQQNLMANLIPQYQKLTALPLRIPRKPHWTKDMTKIELEDKENMAFLQWRRGIATMEENFIRLSITPYEKNLEVWRQLWRSLERSDLAVQIIDARNPMFFYCPDLKIYLNEMIEGGELKGMLVVLNKADLLSDEIRDEWNRYFCEQGIDHVFFSAKKELDIIEGVIKAGEKQGDDKDESDSEEDEEYQTGTLGNKFGKLDIDSDQEQVEQVEKLEEVQQVEKVENDTKIEHQQEKVLQIPKSLNQQNQINPTTEQNYLNTSKLLNRQQLHTLLRKLSLKYWEKKHEYLKKQMTDIKQQNEQQDQTQSKHQSTLSNKLKLQPVVGMIGYPNVGKSSLINALLGKKQVAVAAMPGLSQSYKRMCLCDCPGLVFPSFTNSRAELVCAGVIPIDHLREFLTSIDLVTQRVKKEQLEQCYKISLPQKFSGLTFLKKVAAQRGFVTGSSLPDTGKVARLVLKDFVSGKLCFCHGVPSNQEDEQKEIVGKQVKDAQEEEEVKQDNQENHQLQKQQTTAKTLKQQKQSELDDDFFVGEEKQMKHKTKLTKQQKRAVKFAILRGDSDIQGSVSKAIEKNSKKFAKGHKVKIGKEYYGVNEVIQRGKGGMDLTDF